MAIVPNLALQGGPNPGSTTNVDPSYTSYSRTTAASPNGVTTPAFAGEIVLDLTNFTLWQAMGTGSSSWIALTGEVT